MLVYNKLQRYSWQMDIQHVLDKIPLLCKLNKNHCFNAFQLILHIASNMAAQD